MDKEKILDILQDLDLLNKYSEFIPESYKHTYNQILDNIKSQVVDLKSGNNSLNLNSNRVSKENFNTSIENRVKFIDKNYTKIFDIVLDSIIVQSDNKENTLNSLLKKSDKNILDFLENYEILEKNKEITFSKNVSEIPNRGWIKIGEILINAGLISLENLKEAINYQNSKSDLFLGQSLIELKFLNQSDLRKALKVQRWIFKVCNDISKQDFN